MYKSIPHGRTSFIDHGWGGSMLRLFFVISLICTKSLPVFANLLEKVTFTKWIVQSSDPQALKKSVSKSCSVELLNPHLNADLYLIKCNGTFPTYKLFVSSQHSIEESISYKLKGLPHHNFNPDLNDPQSHDQWALSQMNVASYWKNQSLGSPQIKVAIIDTGVDYYHEDLKENIAINTFEIPDNNIDDDKNGYIDDYYGWNAFDKSSDPMDTNKHGTHISGVIGASTNNNIGVAGINWKVSLIPIKFFGPHNEGNTESAIRAFDYAFARGAKIINISWGGNTDSPLLKNVIQQCQQRGILVVVAAGNETVDNDKVPSYPATYPLDNIISVASIDWHSDLSWFSNWGANSVHVAAPGESILSTIYGNKYGFMEGTSMAAPQIVGAAALIWANHPHWTYKEIKSYILEHCVETVGLKDIIQCHGYFSF